METPATLSKRELVDSAGHFWYIRFVPIRRRTQVVRERSAKPSCTGSNPVGAFMLARRAITASRASRSEGRSAPLCSQSETIFASRDLPKHDKLMVRRLPNALHNVLISDAPGVTLEYLLRGEERQATYKNPVISEIVSEMMQLPAGDLRELRGFVRGYLKARTIKGAGIVGPDDL